MIFGFGKSNSTPPLKKDSWLTKLRGGLARTRGNLIDNLSRAILGKKTIDADLIEELETILLCADLGTSVTDTILAQVTQQVKRKELSDPQVLLDNLRQYLITLLEPCCKPLDIHDKPFTILVVGINGAGKTTSIAKLAYHFKKQGKKIILAAGDTFRAAAVEQLQTWGKRNDITVVAQQQGSDSASVVYDALAAAKARDCDLLIADTAGRLHTQNHLMDELAKIKRVMGKFHKDAPHETLLIVDAGIGQNALVQAQQFNDAIGIDSIAITKLDGTAKGGMVFAIAEQLRLPIRFIGVGENIDDLKPFNATEFVNALFDQHD